MINLLFTLVFSEMGLILVLLVGTPLRNLVIKGIDLTKQGRGPLVTRTVAATLLVVFSSVVYSVVLISRKASESGVVNTTEEVLMAERLLEASLMGFSLFLVIIIDGLHYYIKELQKARKELEKVKEAMNAPKSMAATE